MFINKKEDVVIFTLDCREEMTFFNKILVLTIVGVGVKLFLVNELTRIE